jgi:hypothetical protein
MRFLFWRLALAAWWLEVAFRRLGNWLEDKAVL